MYDCMYPMITFPRVMIDYRSASIEIASQLFEKGTVSSLKKMKPYHKLFYCHTFENIIPFCKPVLNTCKINEGEKVRG